jgi:hypothetical protein
MKKPILSKAMFLLLVVITLTSCSFSYCMYRDCDGKPQKVKISHPRAEWRLGY